MSQTLQELVTVLGFDVDKKNLAGFDRTMAGIKKTALEVGAAMGLGFGVKKMVDGAMAINQAEVRLRSTIAGTTKEERQQKYDAITQAIEGSRKALAGLPIEFNKIESVGKQAAAAFFSQYEDTGEKNIKVFQTLLETSGRLAVSTGEDFADSFNTVMAAAQSGSVDALKELPGITGRNAKQFEMLTGLINEAFGADTWDASAVNVGRVADLLDKVNKSMPARDIIDAMPRGFRASKEAAIDLRGAIENLGEKAMKALTPLIEGVATLADKFADATKNAEGLLGVVKNIVGKETPAGKVVGRVQAGVEAASKVSLSPGDIGGGLLEAVKADAKKAVEGLGRAVSTVVGEVTAEPTKTLRIEVEVGGKLVSYGFSSGDDPAATAHRIAQNIGAGSEEVILQQIKDAMRANSPTEVAPK